MPRAHRRLLLAGCLLCSINPVLAPAQPPGQIHAAPTVSSDLEPLITATAGKPPAPPVDDAAFLRRVRLDLTGHVPSVDEIRAFLADAGPDRRARLVDRLLASPEFHRHWGSVIASWLLGERPINRESYDGRFLQAYLAQAIAQGKPYRQIVRELLTASGSSQENGPVHFLLRFDADPVKLAGGVGKAFMGATIQCAQCHDHPFAAWTQDDFWGLAAAFARLRRLESNEGDGPALLAVHEARNGDLLRPNPLFMPPANPNPSHDSDSENQTEPQPQPDAQPSAQPEIPAEIPAILRLPDGSRIPDPNARRQALAEWLVADQNPYLARNLANRIWAELMGQPLVLRLDDPSAPSPTSPVLDRLAQDLNASNQNLSATLRILLLSPTYAQQSQARDRPPWARRSARPIPVDSLLASISLATGYLPTLNDDAADDAEMPEDPAEVDVEVEANANADPGPDPAATPPLPPPDHQKPASAMRAPAMSGRSNPAATSADPPPHDPHALPLPSNDTTDHPAELLGLQDRSLSRALILMNGAFLHEAARSAARITVARLGPAIGTNHLDEACLATLGRLPDPRERAALQKLLQNNPLRGLEDAYWSLLNSAEFQTNH
jgi:hypothetical protein